MSVLIELTLRHLHYHLTYAPSQPNSQPDNVFRMHTLRQMRYQSENNIISIFIDKLISDHLQMY